MLLRLMKVLTFSFGVVSSVGAPVAAQVKTTYSYDSLGRLVASKTEGGNETATSSIDLDPAGNRRSYRSTAPAQSFSTATRYSAGIVVVPLNGFTIIFASRPLVPGN